MVSRRIPAPPLQSLTASTAAAASGQQAAVVQALLLDNQVCFALYSASLAMTKLYTPVLQALGLTYPQYLVMLVLWERDGLVVSELGEKLFLDSGTLTPLFKRMESAGLLARQRDALDERRVRVTLTAEGQALRARAETVPACMLDRSECTPAELHALTRQLQTLRHRLGRNAAGDI